MNVRWLTRLMHSVGLEGLGRYYSIYRGFVEDNNDPKGLGRVLVSVPQLFGESTIEHWSFPFAIPAYSGFGLKAIPKKGEMIWIQFENGDSRYPVWTFGHWGENDTTKIDLNKVVFETQAGHRVEFDEKLKTTTISVNKTKIVVSDGSINIMNSTDDLGSILSELSTALTGAIVTTQAGVVPLTNASTFVTLNQRIKNLVR